MEDKILNETTSFCNECLSKECCKEEECVLYRIEQIVLNNKENASNTSNKVENDTNT